MAQKPKKQKAGSELQKIKQHFDVVTENLDSKISLIAEQYVDIKNDLEIIKHQLRLKVDHDEFRALERRVGRLEARQRR